MKARLSFSGRRTWNARGYGSYCTAPMTRPAPGRESRMCPRYRDSLPRRERQLISIGMDLVELGEKRYYAIEAVRSKGQVTRYGPVSPRLQADSQSVGMDPAGLPFENADVGIAYGFPDATSLQVVNRDQHQVTVELTVGGVFATVDRTGSLRFHLPGFEEDIVIGIPTRYRYCKRG